jgi:2,5-furandicarboxylate decarboxylase 1
MSGLDLRFRTALARLEAAGRVTRVTREVSTDLEVAGLMKTYDGDRALLFEHVAGHRMRVLGNFLASPANAEAALGLDRQGIRERMRGALVAPLAPVDVPAGPCQDMVKKSGIDLGKDLPVLTHSSGDAGRFITAGVVIVRDPDSGIHNASYHRLQLLGPDRTAIRLDYGRHLRTAYERAKKTGRPLPIAVCLGTDLALHYAAAFMGSQMPLDADELAAAGGIRGAPLEMVRCVSQDLSVPAETEIVIEGEVTFDTAHEGPFAEFVGYQSDAGPAPIVRVTALTHRREPIYHAINGAGRETIMLRKYVLEASALQALRAAVPIVEDVEMTPGGLYRFHLVIQVRKQRPQDEGMQRNAILAAFAALKDLDYVIVVDDDIEVRDPVDVEYALATRFEASRDILLIPGAKGHEYIRVSDGGIRTKMGIDATVRLEERDRFRRAEFARVELRPDEVG